MPPGLVDEISAALLPDAGDGPLVALGGGRVIDTAKAIGGVTGAPVAAIPTTLSGAELTPFHRTPAGVEGARMVSPSLVIADPRLMASQPGPELWASAMNALAHGMEALYTPLANPVAEAAALRGARAIFDEDVALGAFLCGWASGMTGFAVHHATCQLLVRTAGSPHAQTNAVMLPHFAGLMAPRVPGVMGELARALGDPDGDPAAAAGRAAKLSARSGHTRLATLGVEEEHLPRGRRGRHAAPRARQHARPAGRGRAARAAAERALAATPRARRCFAQHAAIGPGDPARRPGGALHARARRERAARLRAGRAPGVPSGPGRAEPRSR